ncbi:BAH and coiled-coil domain-containing protein 1 [Latimeria chalumnae]|uniref:BAH and coiled-coil domain-containing protein 1 n=1 Tax=Latimeria chalumnae TaxID=7897 RepID=UPI00313A9B33
MVTAVFSTDNTVFMKPRKCVGYKRDSLKKKKKKVHAAKCKVKLEVAFWSWGLSLCSSFIFIADNFYLRGLPAQPTLLSANHSFPTIARAAPGHPIGSCSRDRETSHLQKNFKESERLLTSKELSKEKNGKNDSRERHTEEEVKERHKIVLPMTADVQCKEDAHHRSSCENRTKHLNSCLINSKIMNGDSSRNMLPSCTLGVLPRQGNNMAQSRCAKDTMRSEKDLLQNGSGPMHSECFENRQMLHHSVSYSVPSSLPNIPPPLSTASGTFPCLQLHSNPDILCPSQDKTGRDFKTTGPTFVPSVGHYSDNIGPFQVTPENCRVDRSEGKERLIDKGTEQPGVQGTPHLYFQPKMDGKGDRAPDWSYNSASRSKSIECPSSASVDVHMPSTPQAAKGSSGKGSTYVTPQSQDCSRSNHQEALSGKISQSCCTLDKVSRDFPGQSSQRVARIRHQQHRPPELEQTGSTSDVKRKSIDLSSLGYNGPHLPPWSVQGQGPQISIGEERKSSYLDPFNTSLPQAALMPQGSVLSQEIQGSSDEVSAMKNLLKYSNQALIVGQKAPFGGLGNMKASCAHQEMKFQAVKGPQDLERPDCAKSRETETSQGDGEVRQPPVGIAVAVARQKDTHCRPEIPYSANSNRQGRAPPGIKGSARSMHVIDLETEEERLGFPGRELLLRDNKELVEFTRIHPSKGCPGDLASHLMVPGNSSLQASQLGTDSAAHTHPPHPHWLPRTGSPSLWMSGHSYGIGHPALHQNLPPGFPAAMPSAMQSVFQLSQDPSAQLVILPTEAPPHTTPHSLGQRKPEEQHTEFEEPAPEKSMKSSNKTVALNSSKGIPSPALHPPSTCTAKFSPCCHSPALQHPSKCPTPQPATPCTLPVCPDASPAVAPRSPAVSPAPSKSSKGDEPEEKRAEGQPLQDYPKSLEPDFPPGYAYPAVSMGYSAPSPHDAHSADPADPETMQTVSTAAEPEQTRTFTPSEEPHCDARSTETLEEATPTNDEPMERKMSSQEDDAESLILGAEMKQASESILPAQADTAGAGATQPSRPALAGREPEERTRHSDSAQGVFEGKGITGEEANGEEGAASTKSPLEASANETLISQNSGELNSGDETEAVKDRAIPTSHEVEKDSVSPNTSVTEERSAWTSDSVTGLDVLVAAGVSMGELPTLDQMTVFPHTVNKLTFNPSSGIHGIALLSELVDLELQQQKQQIAGNAEEENMGSFDLQSLATIAAAWSLLEAANLEMDPSMHHLPPSKPCLAQAPRRRTLQRKYTWTPKIKTVCPIKAAIDRMDTQEVEMRMKLAELQRRYKEKQRELVKLQKRHDQQRDEQTRSPARRGPGRPRKRKYISSVLSSLGQLNQLGKCDSKKARSMKPSLNLLCTEQRDKEEPRRKKSRISGGEYSGCKNAEIKARPKTNSAQSKLGSKLVKRVSHLKQKVKGKTLGSSINPFRRKEQSPSGKMQKKLGKLKSSDAAIKLSNSKEATDIKTKHSGTTASKSALKVDSTAQEMLSSSKLILMKNKTGKKGISFPKKTPGFEEQRKVSGVKVQKGGCRKLKQEALTEKEVSSSECDSSSLDRGDDGDDDSEDGGDDNVTGLLPKDSALGLHSSVNNAVIGPSPSSVVKMEANQKAKKKKERQGLLGPFRLSNPEGDVKIKKRPAKHAAAGSSGALRKTAKHPVVRKNGTKEGENKKKLRGLKEKQKVKPWQQFRSDPDSMLPCKSLLLGDLARRSPKEPSGKASSEHFKKATRKSKVLQSAFKKKSGTLGLSLSPRSTKTIINKGKKLTKFKSKLSIKQSKGRAVSKLLESFAAEEDFEFDNSSFSEEEEETAALSSATERPTLHVQSCTINKEELQDGLGVLIPKEDNLLYAACVKTLQPPDIYSIVIEGERGNRQRIYSLEQLLQEAVLDVRPQSSKLLPPGTRVCAYWSQKSRCLYPGSVVKGSSSDEEEDSDNSVMVEFDDGDMGRISVSNIRLLPPNYKIQCTEPSPALLVSNGNRRAKRLSSEKSHSSETSQTRSSDGKDSQELGKNSGNKVSSKGKPGKGDDTNSGAKTITAGDHFLGRHTNTVLSWPSIAQTRKKASSKNASMLQNLFQLNGSAKKIKAKEVMFTMQTIPAPVFSSSFGVNSFGSIANGYTSFGSSASLVPTQKTLSAKKTEKQGPGTSKGGKKKAGNEFLVKLDHEGVMSPKTKNGKALLMGEKEFGMKVESSLQNLVYAHPTLMVKDKKGRASLQNLPMGLAMGKFSSQSEYGINCDSDCHSSYSDMDDDDDNEENLRRNVSSRFMSRLSVSSTSSGSSTSSSSGSMSTSSLCSSDNEDSSYSSEEEDSTLLLQTCLTHPVPALLAPSETLQNKNNVTERCFIAKAVAVGTKSKTKRKESLSSSKAKELTKRQRLPSVENRPKISAFLPARQLWKWSGNPTQRRGMKGKARKLYYKAIVRGKETLCIGDCAVFLSAGRPNLPYIGRIESMWESWGNNMVVKVKWFYHPEETKLGKRHSDGKNALYQSCHEDENDVQTISHKCQVVSREQYEQMRRSKKYQDTQDLYYLAGTYDPTIGRLVSVDGVPILC